jgi:predicted DNA-binding transcriptional regulator AlpA
MLEVPQQKFLTARQLASLFGFSLSWIYRRSYSSAVDYLPSYRIGRAIRYDADEFALWMESHRSGVHDSLSPEDGAARDRRLRSMFRRRFQHGSVTQRGRKTIYWEGAWPEYEPGSSRPIRRSVKLGLKSEMSCSEAERTLSEILREINSPDHRPHSSVTLTEFWLRSHSVDDASDALFIEAVNEPPGSQDIFNRKGSRGRSGFDIRHNFVGNFVYELPFGRRKAYGGWQLSGIASAHSNVPFTPVLSFDNADLQSLIISERPNLIGDPYSGVCPNGTRVGTPACWFNPSAFGLPPPGHLGTAGRNSLKGPTFAQFDLALRKTFHLRKETEIAFGAEAFNLLNHPNFAVPSNTQSPLTLGGNGDAVFKNAAANFADNSGRIFTTVGTGRQIQLDARLVF